MKLTTPLARKLQAKMDTQNIFNINSYIDDGFKKVCDVKTDPCIQWTYKNIDRTLMFSSHNSWVYFIVRNGFIEKVGETGNPLGINSSAFYAPDYYDPQPSANTKSRFGRLRNGDGTDHYIRRAMHDDIEAGVNVSLWAKKCDILTVTGLVGGVEQSVNVCQHKSLELIYLNHFIQHGGHLPALNKAKK